MDSSNQNCLSRGRPSTKRERRRKLSRGRWQGEDWNHTDWGDEVPVEVPLNSADPSRHDALLLPGGVMNPDTVRMNPDAMRFAKHFFDAGKPVAAICHGPWTVVEIDAARGRTLTSWPSLNTDMRNAGGNMGGQRSRYG